MKDNHETTRVPDMGNSEDLDLLLSRIIDRQADESDWWRYDRLALADPDLAGEVVRFLRADALLGLSLDEEFQRSALQPEPQETAPSESPSPRAEALRARSNRSSWTTWSGWLTAAALALALLGTRSGQVSNVEPTQDSVTNGSELARATVAPEDDPAASSTRVIEELPLVLIDTRLSDDGNGYEVTVLRQVVESRHVGEVLGVARDEQGRPSPIPIDPASLTPPAVL